MVNNNLCLTCEKRSVCKITDILFKFSDEAKTPLGVDITINKCSHYSSENNTESDKCSSDIDKCGEDNE